MSNHINISSVCDPGVFFVSQSQHKDTVSSFWWLTMMDDLSILFTVKIAILRDHPFITRGAVLGKQSKMKAHSQYL